MLPLKASPRVSLPGGNLYSLRGPVLFGLEIDDSVLYLLRDCIQNHDRRYDGPLPKVVCMYPEPEPPYAHSALPDSIRKDFMELQLILKQRLAPALVISGCRTILEIAVKELGEKVKSCLTVLKTSKARPSSTVCWPNGRISSGMTETALRTKKGNPTGSR